MRDIQLPGRSVCTSLRAMVATSQPMATAAGLEILRRGGNAMDAAIAAGATLCVTEPQSTGIGGDCFLLYYEAASGELHGYNGSGRAPAAATPAAIRARGYDAMPEFGPLSVTVPGAVDAWDAALARFGSMTLAQVLEPAIHYAQEGWAVSPVVAQVWRLHEAALAEYPETARRLLPEGRAPAAGTRHRQPDLARSLRLLAAGGRDVFYEGEIAERIAAFCEAQGGLLSASDLRAHRGEWVRPVHTDYGGLRVHEIPPNGQGITVLMMLNILAHTRLAAHEHLGAAHVHLLTEAYRLARAERDRFVSDPGFGEVPVETLLSPELAARQWARIDPARALPEPLRSALPGGGDTVYLTVVDEQRNAVSFINSLYHPWGSRVMAGNTGIMLQNRGGGFVLREGHVNCLAPRKRPMHTIIPAMAFRDGRPVLSFGVMGGEYQPMGHAYVLSNWLDFGMDLQESVDAARFLPAEGNLVVERPLAQQTRLGLARLGHRVTEAESPHGGAQAIHIDWQGGALRAASDARKDGCALGY